MRRIRNLIYPAILLCLFSFCNNCWSEELDPLDQLDALVEYELEKEKENPQENRVLVALFLDTEDEEDANATAEAEYRCYDIHDGGRCGFSGIERIPFKAPWVRWEHFSSNDLKREIVINPGPPYKDFTKVVNLIPSEVTYLGRIVLEKVKAEGTVSICGTIKDESGKLLKDVKVSSEKDVVFTNDEGFYRIDGLGLEVCNLTATKEGHVPNNAKVSIRNMDKRIIEQDFVMSFPRKVKFYYVISPLEKDDFNCPEATDGEVEFLVNEQVYFIPADKIENEDFRRFAEQVVLNFRIYNGQLTIDNAMAPIFYKHLRVSDEKFDAINSVGELGYNAQGCPAIQKGDTVLINGGKTSNYTLKILFEEVQVITP